MAVLAWCLLPLAIAGNHAFAEKTGMATVRIAFLTMEREAPPALSNLETEPGDLGMQGARLALRDNDTTGSFLKQDFQLEEVVVPIDGDPLAAFHDLVTSNVRHIVTHLPADTLLKIADLPEAKDVLLYNASAPDDALRNGSCRPNLLHIFPSRAMLADALAQYLIRKRWSRWFLVVGPSKADMHFAEAVKRAADRFGGRIVAEKNWIYTHDARRTAQAEVPVFTQGVDYDILILADERGDFGEYFAYRSWEPRPTAGTQGLTPTAWHHAHEQWGATQLQRRFRKLTGRPMRAIDYAAWLSVRAIGEAATRTQSVEFRAIRHHLLDESFALQGFKGRKLTFRQWNRQLRQPILLAAPKALVATAPQEGFLHPETTLDTLGYDEPESSCKTSTTKNRE